MFMDTHRRRGSVCLGEGVRGRDRGGETDVNCHDSEFTDAHNHTKAHRSQNPITSQLAAAGVGLVVEKFK